MNEETLRWGIGLLVAGNAYFIVDTIRRSNHAHDQSLVLNEKVDALGHAVKAMNIALSQIADLRTDVALLKFKVFGKPRANGRDKTESAEIDLGS